MEHPSPSSASTSSSSGHRVEFRRASLAALYIPALNGGVFRAARINEGVFQIATIGIIQKKTLLSGLQPTCSERSYVLISARLFPARFSRTIVLSAIGVAIKAQWPSGEGIDSVLSVGRLAAAFPELCPKELRLIPESTNNMMTTEKANAGVFLIISDGP